MLADNLIVHILNSGSLPQVPGAFWKHTMSRTEKEESKGLTLGTSVKTDMRQFLNFSELHILLSASETTMTIWMKNVPRRLAHLSIWLPVGGVWGDGGILGHGALLHHVREVGFKSLYSLMLLPVHGFLYDEMRSAGFLLWMPDSMSSSPLWAPPLELYARVNSSFFKLLLVMSGVLSQQQKNTDTSATGTVGPF